MYLYTYTQDSQSETNIQMAGVTQGVVFGRRRELFEDGQSEESSQGQQGQGQQQGQQQGWGSMIDPTKQERMEYMKVDGYDMIFPNIFGYKLDNPIYLDKVEDDTNENTDQRKLQTFFQLDFTFVGCLFEVSGYEWFGLLDPC